MFVDKPPWVVHDPKCGDVYGVDVCTYGARFATAGGDHKVKIWALGPVLHASLEASTSAPRLLATLADHFGPVNAVRFSSSGRRLATGSDDKLVLVHELRAGAPRAVFGAADPPAVENWQPALTLRGHANNVTDVAWSPDDTLLASASLDNYVFVWDATGARVATLTGHESFVKGVSFDPIGTYLASQSDDRSVIVWRCEDWSVAARVREPFARSVGSTFSLRLGWSPDGRAMTAVNSQQGGIATAAVLDRGEWKRSYELVGHKAPVVAVRFNGRMFHRLAGDTKGAGVGAELCSAVAVGSQDCMVTVWLTSRPKPVVVLKHLFNNTVVDMAWTPDGYSLLCGSLDGGVACITFSADELGRVASSAEVDAALQRTYGALGARRGGQRGAPLAEDPTLLAYAARGAEAQAQARAVAQQQHALAAAAAAAAARPGGPAPLPAGSPQREFRGADGRRRIVPQPVSDGAGGVVTVLPPPARSPLAPPPPSQQPPPLSVAPPAASPFGAASLSQQALAAVVPPPPPPAGTGAAVGATPPRRLVPQPLAPSAAPPPQLPPPAQQLVMMARPPGGGGGGGAPSGGVKRKAPDAAPPQQQPQAQRQLAPAPAPTPAPAAPPAALALAPLSAALVAELCPAEPGVDGAAATVLEARNAGGGAALSCSRGGASLWSDRLSAPCVALAGTRHFSAAASADGALHVYTPAGRRALPPLSLGGPAAFLAAAGTRLAACAATGALWLWDLSPDGALGDAPGGACVLHDTLLPVLAGAPPGVTVAALRLAACGAPLAVRTDGAAFALSAPMRCWVRVADGAFLRSDFASTLTLGGRGDAAGGELAALGAAASRAALRAGGAAAAGALLLGGGGAGGDARALTGRHLEALLAAAGALESPAELRRYLPLYAAHLARDGQEARLRELLQALLGPTHWREPQQEEHDAAGAHAAAAPGGWAPRLLGLRKRALLTQDVLPAVAAQGGAQRLAAEYADLCAEMEGE